MDEHAKLLAAFLTVSVLVTAVPAAGAPALPADPTASAGTDCEFPVEVTDATGTTVRIEDEPEEVVTLAPSAAQTMWEIGAREKVVGVSQFATYLDGAGERANVSAPGFGKYNVERIVSLDPDLVLAPNVVANPAVDNVRSTGIPVVKFEAATSIADVRNKTRLTGRLVGECEGAADANEWMDRNLAAVESAVEGTEPPRTLYLTGTFTTGGGTYVDDMIEAAGATNVMAEAGVNGFKKVNREVVAERDPQWILVTNPEAPILSEAPFNSTTAVEQGNVVTLNPNFVNQPAPRSVVVSVTTMAENFHPEAYGEDDYVTREAVEATPTETRTPTGTVTETPPPDTLTETPTRTDTATAEPTATRTPTATPGTGDTPTTTEGGSTPGFGAGATLVAVLATALVLVARRRRR